MSRNRFFNFIIAMVLLSVLILTVHQAWAISQVVPAETGRSIQTFSDQGEVQVRQCPFSPKERRSMRAEVFNGSGLWLARTDSGCAGLEGGALALLGC